MRYGTQGFTVILWCGEAIVLRSYDAPAQEQRCESCNSAYKGRRFGQRGGEEATNGAMAATEMHPAAGRSHGAGLARRGQPSDSVWDGTAPLVRGIPSPLDQGLRQITVAFFSLPVSCVLVGESEDWGEVSGY